MKKIKLTRNKFALVDDDVYPFLNKFTWWLCKGKYDKIGYAVRSKTIEKKKQMIFMHHFLLPKINGYVIDHRNRDSLDNRYENLRYATILQNARNRRDSRFKLKR